MTPQPTTQDEKTNDETQPTKTSTTLDDDDDDLYIPLTDEMSSEYREMLHSLGHHPDKVKINTLSMIADDHALSPPSSSTIYSLIRDPLLSSTFHPQKKLPLVYVIDSILKNVGGLYTSLIADDAGQWMTAVVDGLEHPAKQLPPDCHPEMIKAKLKKVWTTWNDGRLFDDEVLKDMGRCFVKDDERRKAAVEKAAAAAAAGGGTSGAAAAATSPVDALPVPLRQRMQIILDELTSDESELDKVSLERLSQIDPKLFSEIKKAALDALRGAAARRQQQTAAVAPGAGGAAAASNDDDLMMDMSGIPSIFIETRPLEVIRRGREWELSSGWKNRMAATNDIVSLLQKWVREGSFNVAIKKKSEETKTDDDEEDNKMEEDEEEDTDDDDDDDDDGEDDVNRLAAAGCVANVLTTMLQKVTKMEESDEEALLHMGVGGGTKGTTTPGGVGAMMMGGMMGGDASRRGGEGGGHVDKTLFTTEGIGKELNKWMVGMLYERGLPFVSSADGRRFGTEGELSQHLDKLFKKAQVEKTMEKTEERGWYTSPSSWLGLGTTTSSSTDPSSTTDPTSNANNANANANPDQNKNANDADDSNDDKNNKDPRSCIVPADENRSKCIICGIPFEMFFDQDQGEFMYSNCTEIDVMNDNDVAVEDSEVMLVHETCRRGLGDVEYLTMDQVMQS